MSLIRQLFKQARYKYSSYSTYRFYSSQFKRYLAINGYNVDWVEGEDEYVKTWSSLTNRVDRYSYRLFSHYMGKNRFIIPEDIGDSVIEFYLNPVEFRAFYSDKNMFARFLQPVDALPKELLRKIGRSNVLLDGEYKLSEISEETSANDLAVFFSEAERLIIKPAENSNSGASVQLFCRQSDEKGNTAFINERGEALDGSFLRRFNYGGSFVLQEALEQHPYLARFCSTSVNTLRLCMYRSVVDESVTMFAAAIRIGHTGSIVDNLHAGGGFVKVDVNTGELGHTVYDQYGGTSGSINGIDFNNCFRIPEWESVRTFAESITRQIDHMRLLSLDVMLDRDARPRLIEFNVKEFAFWIPMFSGQQVFGDRIEEVIAYCHNRLVRDKRI